MARKNKKKKTLAFKNAVAGYLFIAPFIIGFILFLVVPLVQSLRMSFSTVELEGGLSMTWAGLENYRQAFLVDEQFVPNLISELVKMLTNVPATLIFSFFIALLLNQSFKGRGAVRAIFFLPVILSSGVIVGLESGNTLLADMKDAIEATNNNTSITGVLESILITSDSSPMSQMFSYVFDIINSVYHFPFCFADDFAKYVRGGKNRGMYCLGKFLEDYTSNGELDDFGKYRIHGN